MDPLQTYRDEVQAATAKAFAELGIDDAKFDLEVPSTAIADFAVPCFPFAKILKKAPVAIAAEVSAKIQPSALISKVWAENGYLNFNINAGKLAQ